MVKRYWKKIVLLAILTCIAGGSVLLLFFSVEDRSGDMPSDQHTEEEAEDIPDTSSVEEETVHYSHTKDTLPTSFDTQSKADIWRVYFVLDDAGQSLEEWLVFTKFPGLFTVAVLPALPYSEEIAHHADSLGHTVFLHQPMEAVSDKNPGKAAIFLNDEPHTIQAVLRDNLNSLPKIAGVNNHMGSLITANEEIMEVVITEIAARGLLFLDSRTTHLSVGAAVARRHNVPVVSRDVFLDNIRSKEAISLQLDKALQIAKERGSVVMIGHVTSDELAEVLIQRYDEIQKQGFQFLPMDAYFLE